MLKGNSLKYYNTADFLNLAPLNISSGFRYDIKFGLDFDIQPRICDEIPALFNKGLKQRLQHHLQTDSPDFVHYEVTFHSAGSSSLDLRILFDVNGRCADEHDIIEREIHTALVSICNDNGLVIPFNQLSVTLTEDSKSLTPTKTPSQNK